MDFLPHDVFNISWASSCTVTSTLIIVTMDKINIVCVKSFSSMWFLQYYQQLSLHPPHYYFCFCFYVENKIYKMCIGMYLCKILPPQQFQTTVCVCVCVYVYIYIYIHTYHHQSVLPKGKSFIANAGIQAAVLPKAGLPPQTKEPRNQDCSFARD